MVSRVLRIATCLLGVCVLWSGPIPPARAELPVAIARSATALSRLTTRSPVGLSAILAATPETCGLGTGSHPFVRDLRTALALSTSPAVIHPALDPSLAHLATSMRVNVWKPHDAGIYEYQLGAEALETVARLGPEGHIIEMGPGEQLPFVREYFGNDARFPRKARVTAVGVGKAKAGVVEALRAEGHAVVYVEAYAETIHPGDLAPADVILDRAGPAWYTLHPKAAWEGYGALLKPGGRVFTSFKVQRSVFVEADGTLISYPEYLAKAAGFVVEELTPIYGGEDVRMVVRRTEGRVVLPEARLVALEGDVLPPGRLFVIVPPTP